MGQVRRTVHVPLGLPCQPASCQGDPNSVGMLRDLSEMFYRPIVAAPIASPAAMAVIEVLVSAFRLPDLGSMPGRGSEMYNQFRLETQN
jgi:hypothetical protein